MQQAKFFICTILAILVLATAAQKADALQVISPSEGEGVFVNISKLELNMIQFPMSGIKSYTSSQKLELKVQGRHVLVSMTDQSVNKPQEVFFETPAGTYLLMLVPKSIPAETIVMRVKGEEAEDAGDWEKGNDYERRLKELVKALYLGKPPAGYAMKNTKLDASIWEGIEQTVVMTMEGAGLVGEIHEIYNRGDENVRIAEREFYEDGVLAVSLTSHDLRAGSKENAFVVRRRDVPVGNRPLRSQPRQVMASQGGRTGDYDYSQGEPQMPPPPHMAAGGPGANINAQIKQALSQGGNAPLKVTAVSQNPGRQPENMDNADMIENEATVPTKPRAVRVAREDEDFEPASVTPASKKTNKSKAAAKYKNRKTYSEASGYIKSQKNKTTGKEMVVPAGKKSSSGELVCVDPSEVKGSSPVIANLKKQGNEAAKTANVKTPLPIPLKPQPRVELKTEANTKAAQTVAKTGAERK